MRENIEEIAKEYYRGRFRDYMDSKAEPYSLWMQKRQMHEHKAALLRGAAKVSVLDVGSGPITTLGCLLPKTQVELIATDCYADAYNEVLDEFGLDVPVRPRPIPAKQLFEEFGADRFDLVHCRNALDHMADPIKCLQVMASVTKSNGYIWIDVFSREGSSSGYEEMHQWDVYMGPDGCVMLDGPNLGSPLRLLTVISDVADLYKLESFTEDPRIDPATRKLVKGGIKSLHFINDSQVTCGRTIRVILRKR